MSSLPKAFRTPEYVPSEYTYSGLRFDQLQVHSQLYLRDVLGITTPSASPETLRKIEECRTSLMGKLQRTLMGNDIAIICKKLEATYTSRTSSDSTQIVQDNAKRVHEVSWALLPERLETLNIFMNHWDALVWLEMEGMGENERPSVEQQKEIRNEGSAPMLRYADRALVELDEKIMQEGGRVAQLLLELSRPLPPPYTSADRLQEAYEQDIQIQGKQDKLQKRPKHRPSPVQVNQPGGGRDDIGELESPTTLRMTPKTPGARAQWGFTTASAGAAADSPNWRHRNASVQAN